MSGMSIRHIAWTRLLATASVGLVLPAIAQAQSINHAELEELFGEPVTTSVTGKPQRASEAPAALVIITRDDIRRSPANDIPGLVQAYAGIDVVRWTAGHSDVSIRGGVQAFNPRLLVLVNGRQVYLDHYGMTNWAGLGVQLEEIQQIEIVRGPNSALFGFNAVSGVINIITINPLQSRQLTMTAEVGAEGQVRASGVAAIKLADNFGLRLSGGYDVSDELGGLNSSTIAPQVSSGIFDPKHTEVAGELYGKFGEQTEVGLSANHIYNRRIEYTYFLLSTPIHYKLSSVGARVSHDTGWGVLSARAFQNWSNTRTSVTVAATDVRFDNEVFVASADALIRAGTANTLRIGAEYRANNLTMSPGYPGTTRYDVYAGSGMWESRLDNAITLTLAARVDHLDLEQQGTVDQLTIFTKENFNRSITEWSFNSALLFKLNDLSSLRMAGGRGVQAPSLFSFGARLNLSFPGVPVPLVIAGNPAIEPAEIWSAEIGFNHQFSGHDSRFGLTAFYNRTNDVISAPVPQTPPSAAPPAYPFILFLTENVGAFEAYGLEASLDGQFEQGWKWALNYTWTKAKQHIKGNTGGQFEWPLALDSATPEHKIRAQLSYERDAWLATVTARYASAAKQLVSPELLTGGPMSLFGVGGAVALDAKLAFKAGDKLTFAIAGENLTDARGADLSPVPAERRLRATIQIGF